MFLRNRFIGTTGLALEGEGQGGGAGGTAGGAGGAAGQGGSPPAAFVPPWGTDVNKPWMLGESGKERPWYEATLPDGPTKEFVKSKNYGNPQVMADALYSATRMVNGNAAELPSIDAPPEKWAEFTGKLRGESVKTPEDYRFTFGKNEKGEEIKPDEGLLKFAQKVAFDTGLHPKRAQELIVEPWQKFAQEQNARMAQEAAKANEDEANAVRTKWGENFESLRAGGERVVKALKIAPETLSAIEGHIGAAPLMDLFAQLGKLGAEGTLTAGGGSNQADPVNMSAEQVERKIAELKQDQKFIAAYQDAHNPGHAEAVKQMMSLHELLAKKKQA